VKRTDPVRLDAGVLIIGSLLWDKDRQRWRDDDAALRHAHAALDRDLGCRVGRAQRVAQWPVGRAEAVHGNAARPSPRQRRARGEDQRVIAIATVGEHVEHRAREIGAHPGVGQVAEEPGRRMVRPEKGVARPVWNVYAAAPRSTGYGRGRAQRQEQPDAREMINPLHEAQIEYCVP